MSDLLKSLHQIRKTNNIQHAIMFYNSYQTYRLTDKKIEEMYNIFLSLINTNYDSFSLDFKQRFYENLYKYKFKSESTYSQIVKFMTLTNYLDESVEYLTNFTDNNIPIKLRTIKPIIELSERNNRTNLLSKLLDIIQSYNIILDYTEYSNILSLAKTCPLIYDHIFDNMTINVISEPILTSLKIRYSNYTIVRAGIIDKRCSNCKFNLKSIGLSKLESLQLLTELQTSVNIAKNHRLFDKYIKTIKHNNVSVVIDGANIGYYNRRPDLGGQLSFKQIDRMANYFIKQGKKPLIFLHHRHFINNVSYLDNQIIDSWKKMGIIYITPKGLNDDWYWLYFSINLMNHIDNSLLVTNDNMCDHLFQIFTEKIFNKWKERVLVRYSFDGINPILELPSSYSIIKQTNQGSIHIPYNEMGLVNWLCIKDI